MRLLHFHFKTQNRLLKGTGANCDVCPGSSVSTGTKFLLLLAADTFRLPKLLSWTT